MKRRFVGTVLIGFGVLFLVLAVGLRFFVAPAVTKLPYDMQQCPAPEEPQPDGCLKPSVAEAHGGHLPADRGREAGDPAGHPSQHDLGPAAAEDDGRLAVDRRKPTGSATTPWYGTCHRRPDGSTAAARSSAPTAPNSRSIGSPAPHSPGTPSGSTTPTWVRRCRSTTWTTRARSTSSPSARRRRTTRSSTRNIQQALPARFVDVTSVGDLEAYHFKQEIPRQPAVNVSPASLAALRSHVRPDGHRCQGHVQQRPRGMGGPGHGRLPRRTGAAAQGTRARRWHGRSDDAASGGLQVHRRNSHQCGQVGREQPFPARPGEPVGTDWRSASSGCF